MKLLSEPLVSEESRCSYIPEKNWRFTYFFAIDVTPDELDIILSKGWRKFGMYYFKPVCRDCRACIPIRVLTDKLLISKSQKRVLKNCADVMIEFKDLEFRDEIFEIYKDHSLNRFGKESNYEDFHSSFYTRSCPTIQSEYYIDDRLAGVGFIDVSSNAMSSIYYIYRNEYSNYRLGTFSAIKETEYARAMGLGYYYLGYYIENNRKMSYKNSFHVNEKMNWDTGEWLPEEPPRETKHDKTD